LFTLNPGVPTGVVVKDVFDKYYGEKVVKLQADDLFHSMTDSPIASMRRRAAFMRQHAYCPHPEHRMVKVPTIAPVPDDPSREQGKLAPAHVNYECPDCGVPVYCSKEHWMDDYEAHLEVCDTLRQINEDDHDLRSGRYFPEFRVADRQLDEAVVNMSNWDTYLYSREYRAIDDERHMRQATKLLTYPVTIASVLHEFSPYNIRNRLTVEGLRSFSGMLLLRYLCLLRNSDEEAALRYTAHPPKRGEGSTIKGLKTQAPPMRIFVLGARAESSLPRDYWIEFAKLFPEPYLHLILIGPESMANRDDEFPLPPKTPENPYGAVVEDRVWNKMKISTFVDYYQNLHRTGYFTPYDPYFDCFVLFHPGLGHPASSHEWAEALPMLLETKVPIICTGYTQFDMQRDIEWVKKNCAGEFDILLEPGENMFRSLRWDINDLDPQDISAANWGLWSFRGKR
jgi:mitochondrial splicing suppressor protein 51